jgi:hypothetical protein
MHKRFAVVFLAAVALAAVFILPARAAGKATHVARAYGVKGVVKTARSLASVQRPGHVNVAWTPAATLPVAVEETGGGAGAGNSFYVPGGYENFSQPALNDTVQSYKKLTNTWTNNTSDPFPPVPGLVSGLADAGSCYDPVGKKVHIIDGVAYDATGQGFIIAEHLVYDPAAAPGSRISFLSYPVNSVTGEIWYGQDQGCAFISGKMYLFGGYGVIGGGSAAIQKATWVYDPGTDTWTDSGKLMQHPRLWMGYTSNSTNAFAAAGTDNLSFFTPLNSTEKFTPATGWAATANLPIALLAPGEGLVGTHLVVFGGGNSSFVTQNKTYHCLLPNCSSFTTLSFNLPSSKWFMAFGAGTSIYSAGGDTGSGVPVNTSEHLP